MKKRTRFTDARQAEQINQAWTDGAKVWTCRDLTWQRIDLLEKALAEYIEKYGLTDRARAAMAPKSNLEQVDKKEPPEYR